MRLKNCNLRLLILSHSQYSTDITVLRTLVKNASVLLKTLATIEYYNNRTDRTDNIYKSIKEYIITHHIYTSCTHIIILS